MKKQKMQKWMAHLLVFTCLTGILTGCGKDETVSNKESSSTKETVQEQASVENSEVSSSVVEEIGITYPLDGNKTLTYAIVSDKPITVNYSGYAETPFVKALQEATGVTLEVQEYADKTAMNLMFASGELPDIVQFDWAGYSGGISQAIKDGIVLPLTDYLEYCPDLMNVLNSDSRYILASTSMDGDIMGAPFVIGDNYMLTTCGLMIRQDYLDKVGMEVPQTADQLYDVLVAFKEKLGLEFPMSIYNNYFGKHGLGAGILTSPFGLPKCDLYVEDGKIHYGYYEEAYKDVLTWINKLYNEGLFDPNYATMSVSVQRANFMNGVSGVTMGAPGGDMGTFLTTMADDPTFAVTGFGPIVAKDGDIPMSTHYANPVTTKFAVITPACDDIETAVKFLNYGYTEEGHMLYAFGTEGTSYNMVNDYPTYTELLTTNPDGWTMQQAMAAYARAGQTGPYVSDKRYMEQYSSAPEQVAAMSIWSVSTAADYYLPPYTILEEYTSEYTVISADISTYIDEMRMNFINGKESLDNFDIYLSTLKEMGIERLIEINQLSYDAYMNR